MSVMTTATAATGAATGAAITTVAVTTVAVTISVTTTVDFYCITATNTVSIIHKAKFHAVRPVLGPVRAIIHDPFRGQNALFVLLVRVRTYMSIMYHGLGLFFSVNAVTSTL